MRNLKVCFRFPAWNLLYSCSHCHLPWLSLVSLIFAYTFQILSCLFILLRLYAMIEQHKTLLLCLKIKKNVWSVLHCELIPETFEERKTIKTCDWTVRAQKHKHTNIHTLAQQTNMKSKIRINIYEIHSFLASLLKHRWALACIALKKEEKKSWII